MNSEVEELATDEKIKIEETTLPEGYIADHGHYKVREDFVIEWIRDSILDPIEQGPGSIDQKYYRMSTINDENPFLAKWLVYYGKEIKIDEEPDAIYEFEGDSLYSIVLHNQRYNVGSYEYDSLTRTLHIHGLDQTPELKMKITDMDDRSITLENVSENHQKSYSRLLYFGPVQIYK